jgi:hypothetical protein
MQSTRDRTPWESHDWKVKTLESVSAGGGSRLAFTCRGCERKFVYTTANNRAWATSGDGTALSDEISSRWLAQTCPGRPGEKDNQDRLSLKNPPKPDTAT